MYDDWNITAPHMTNLSTNGERADFNVIFLRVLVLLGGRRGSQGLDTEGQGHYGSWQRRSPGHTVGEA